MAFTVQVLDKSWQNVLDFPDVELKPTRYSHAAIGGPVDAEVQFTGQERMLWELLEWLRCPIAIVDDERKTAVWWGFIHDVEISVGALRITVGLGEMVNRVAVVYSYVAPGTNNVGTRATTAWAQNDDSLAYYGTKELLNSASGLMTAQAESLRDSILGEKYKPAPAITFGQQDQTNSGRLRCKGWWETLKWKYYSQVSGQETHEPTSGTRQDLGRASGNQKAGQSWQIGAGSGFDLASVKVKACKVGTPADNLVVEVYTDAAGAPGTLLTSASMAAGVISTSSTWVEFIMPTLGGGGYVAIAPATTYWVVISRSGAVDGTNYYQMDVDETLAYPRGVLRIWNGSAWNARGTDADMLFQILGGEETTKQLQNIIATCGQFMSATSVDSRSNNISNQYRRGDKTAQVEAEELLKAGVTGGRRLLARVTEQREVIVSEEPIQDRYNAPLFIKRDSSIVSTWGDPYIGQTCPTGVWAVLKDVIPSSLDLGRLADPSMVFIESASYDVEKRQYTPVARGQSSVWDITSRIVEG